ncbi:5-formyltetrahydrofolate cyclo-ligase [Candidatus Blochmannia ocreatus (nom. nud.)]|uniref:5-formyltetrahydrofolate cyclo-ligase n=1 Tax=Candidatus Blochmannia ocreatus (nom. nud.) TaxID=251538 RepID=A0ABY4STM3_9ENTR|nr:5-formyltetrahydrofolate cyclo-ligase [Candidatus Blochmannia ocreatus]URJ25322.1 5-formyltetrahydrofolate cyclo-ligase [Candidatus Blochmannia ocreatus]
MFNNIVRAYIRMIRCSLTFQEQFVASQLITNRIITIKRVFNSKRIAVFFSFDGEISTTFLIRTLLSMRKKIYLPVLSTNLKSKCLLFAQYTLSTSLIFNRFNIYEPQYSMDAVIPIEDLDVVFVPLVAFDSRGYRLGMGGGFYDSTLKHWKKNQDHYIPIGIGYDFQKVPHELLSVKKWDIFLPEIITPSNHFVFR